MSNPAIAIELNWTDITLGDLRAFARLMANMPDDTEVWPAIDPDTLEQYGIGVWVYAADLPGGAITNGS